MAQKNRKSHSSPPPFINVAPGKTNQQINQSKPKNDTFKEIHDIHESNVQQKI